MWDSFFFFKVVPSLLSCLPHSIYVQSSAICFSIFRNVGPCASCIGGSIGWLAKRIRRLGSDFALLLLLNLSGCFFFYRDEKWNNEVIEIPKKDESHGLLRFYN